MRRLNEVVQYDFERNTFYKINKQTGAQSPTYKTGEKMKKFRPDVTGQSYLIRRKSERVEVPQVELRLPKERSFNTERIIPEYSYFKTLESSRRDSKPTETSILMRSTINNGKDTRPVREHSLLRMQARAGEEGQGSREKSEERASRAMLNQTLSSYTKLLKEKVRENHSPRHEQYEGSQTARDPLDTLCTTLSHFRGREPVWESQTPPSNKLDREREPKPLQFSAREASSKQRSLFLDFHPELRTTMNPSRLQAQVQRKRNLKILQELFIRQGNRQTRKTYQSIA